MVFNSRFLFIGYFSPTLNVIRKEKYIANFHVCALISISISVHLVFQSVYWRNLKWKNVSFIFFFPCKSMTCKNAKKGKCLYPLLYTFYRYPQIVRIFDVFFFCMQMAHYQLRTCQILRFFFLTLLFSCMHLTVKLNMCYV